MADLKISSTGGEEALRPQFTHQAPQQAAAVQTTQAVVEPKQTGEQDKDLSQKEKENLPEAIQKLDHMIKPLSIGLNIQRIEGIDRTYVELYDRETGEVIREIPAKQIIEMQKHIREMQGLLFDKFS